MFAKGISSVVSEAKQNISDADIKARVERDRERIERTTSYIQFFDENHLMEPLEFFDKEEDAD